ncbi:PilW family protein [Desulfoscipio gibsoniae]|uniref:Uncharacterized protein n=1 Tax=Desulfoscipio gibsoniae DSM 7213 TaxID=767817 RepID=R4KND9_9FIRM|nr:prepilin-type N-terminal cleavage/methylation domain-containing protein [Desulfoscipio gibsoniae]AGL02045.1 hypothetical protein Desgi_2639 [Desulfoscipio gibsoniae DSM 7213]
MMFKVSNNNGFTLVGLLVAVSLIVIVLSAANSLFAFTVRTYYLNLNRLEVQENLRIGINRVSREVRQAAEITSINSNEGGRLTFKDVNDNVISYRISKSSDYEKAHQLIRSINGYGHNPVARYVTRIDVEPFDARGDVRIIHLKLTGEKGATGTLDVGTTVMLRN